MRIIAGDLRGRSILGPKSDTTRPVTDRVKVAVFNSLQCRLGEQGFAGLAVADLFSGTGSMGLDALSRGAAWCTFVEQDREAANILARNIRDLAVAERCKIERIDLLSDIPQPPPTGPSSFDVIFLDPPYRYSMDCSAAAPMGLLMTRLAPLAATPPLRPAFLILRSMRGSLVADKLPGWHKIDQDTYGTMQIDWYKRSSGSSVK